MMSREEETRKKEEKEEEEEEEDDDGPALSARALEALREFLDDSDHLKRHGDDDANNNNKIDLLPEDWRLSQFWYNPHTANTLAHEISTILSYSHANLPSVACIACPTLYLYLKVSLLASHTHTHTHTHHPQSILILLLFFLVLCKRNRTGDGYPPSISAQMRIRSLYLQSELNTDVNSKSALEKVPKMNLNSEPIFLSNTNSNSDRSNPAILIRLLEYDKRFDRYGDDFIFYDYNQLEELPQSLKHAFQVVVADPPYLSKECLEKVVQTMSFLAQPQGPFLLLLTGAVQKERASELLNLRPCGFRPQHSNKLGNEFCLFTNYDPADRLDGWERTDNASGLL